MNNSPARKISAVIADEFSVYTNPASIDIEFFDLLLCDVSEGLLKQIFALEAGMLMKTLDEIFPRRGVLRNLSPAPTHKK